MLKNMILIMSVIKDDGKFYLLDSQKKHYYKYKWMVAVFYSLNCTLKLGYYERYNLGQK